MRPAGLAPHVLNLAGVLDPNGIPAAVFTSPDALVYLREVVNPDVTADDVRSALRGLHRLNLATVVLSELHRSVRVHAIVQRATRDRLAATLGPVARAAADSLLHVWPDIERDQNLAQVLRSNTQNLQNNVDEHLWQPVAHAVLFRAGRSLGESGLITAAQSHFQTLHTGATHRLGPDHPDTLISRSDLAYWRGVGGDVSGAIEDFQRLLADQVRVLGPDHPDTLIGRSDLAYWRGEGGDVSGAIEDFQRLLADQVRVLGPDHPDTLLGRSNLARCRGLGGDVAGAVEDFRQLLADQARVLGPDHRDTLIGRSDLAYWRGEGGDVSGAIEDFQRLLADQARVLGPAHPGTLNSRSNLAHWENLLAQGSASPGRSS